MTVAPTGTITFLFSDIEGSSKKWGQQPDAMRTALAAHDRMLRESFEAFGGYDFKTVGDAFCVAFDTATDALAGALHTGAAEQRDGDYFGQSLNPAGGSTASPSPLSSPPRASASSRSSKSSSGSTTAFTS